MYLRRQIEHQMIHLSISSDQKMKEMKQEEERKVSQVKQQLKEEQTKSKQKEEEIDELKKYSSIVDSSIIQCNSTNNQTSDNSSIEFPTCVTVAVLGQTILYDRT